MSEIGYAGAFRLGDWHVEPSLNRLSREGSEIEVEPKSMAVLAYLAQRPGQVVSSDELIDKIWQGRPMGDNPVHRCVSRLRQALGDDARQPHYIATVQRKGYRLVAEVQLVDTAKAAITDEEATSRRTPAWIAGGIAAALLIVLAIWTMFSRMPDELAPTIAVLDFDSLSDDIYLAKGVSEEIRTALASVEGLSVASRSASIQFPSGTDPQIISDRLNVSWVLEGTARRDDNEIKVTAQLIDARTRFARWSESYDGTTDAIFGIPDRIAKAVVGSVVSTLPGEWRLKALGTDIISAYDEFLRGQAALDRPHSEQSLNAAESHFRQSLTHDPGYARAHAGLCRTYVAWYIHADATAWVDRAKEACDAARSLDPTLSEVPTALGRLYRRQGRFELAQAAFDQAIAINANALDALTGRAQVLADKGETEAAETAFRQILAAYPNEWIPHTRFGAFLFHRGRYSEAARIYQRVVELRPQHVATLNNLGAALYLTGDLEMAAKAYEESLRIRQNRSAHSNLGTLRYYLGDYDEAVRQYRLAIELKPQDFVVYGNLGDALSRTEDAADESTRAYLQAIDLAERQIAVNPREGKTHASMASYLMRVGRAEQATSHIAQAIEYDPEHPYVRYYASVVYTLLGDRDSAVSQLEQALELGYPRVLAAVDPEFKPLRGLSRYQSLFDPPTVNVGSGS